MVDSFALNGRVSTEPGQLHVVRQIAIAQWLERAGLSVAFAMRRLPGDMLNRLRVSGVTIFELDDHGAPSTSTWLAVDLNVEIAAMTRLLDSFDRAPTWIVVDHYELDARWEAAMARFGSLVCVVDDLADRPHDCEVLLDPTLGAPDRYDGLVPDRTRRYVGVKYAPLRDAFVDRRRGARARDGIVRRILIFYGGVDWSGETLKALRALRTVEGDFAIDVVIGFSNPRCDEIAKEIDRDSRARLCPGDSEMSALTDTADLCLGALGGAMWERCFVGCPSIVTATLDRVAPMGPQLAATGAALWLGSAAVVSADRLAATVVGLLADSARVRSMSEKARHLADGYEAAWAAFVDNFVVCDAQITSLKRRSH